MILIALENESDGDGDLVQVVRFAIPVLTDLLLSRPDDEVLADIIEELRRGLDAIDSRRRPDER